MEQGAIAKTGTDCAKDLWSLCMEELKTIIPPPYFGSIISHVKPLSLENSVLRLGVPNKFNKDIIESKFLDRITSCARRFSGKEIDLEFVVSPEDFTVNPENCNREATVPDFPPEEEGRIYSEIRRTPLLPEKPTPKRYTFENFVVGKGNRFAYYASLMVAEAPGQNYNPLFIYGGTGLGKTHLLLAIEDYAKRLNPLIRVKYVQTSTFIDEFIKTITLKKDRSAFDHKYIQNKIVLFDDIQALGGTDATQHKFFDIFNLLYSSNSHIVLSSDRPPREIPHLSDRIQSRFEGGLNVDIAPPDLETRVAILWMKSKAEGVEIPDDAMLYIASKVESNIRTLEGLFLRVVASARLYGTKIDLAMVQEVLKDQVPETESRLLPTIELIQNLVSDYYGISRGELIGTSRSRNLVHARQVAMYLCRDLTNETLISIGSSFGGRDHSTVLHSCKKVEDMIKESKDILHEVNELTNKINRACCA